MGFPRLRRVVVCCVAALALPSLALGQADLSVTKTDSPDPVSAGASLTYMITVTNNGPNVAAAELNDSVPANTTFVSLTAPAGWSVTTPAVGGTGTITATNAAAAVGNHVFTLVV